MQWVEPLNGIIKKRIFSIVSMHINTDNSVRAGGGILIQPIPEVTGEIDLL